MARPRTAGRMGSRRLLEDAVIRLAVRPQRAIAVEVGASQSTVCRALRQIEDELGVDQGAIVRVLRRLAGQRDAPRATVQARRQP